MFEQVPSSDAHIWSLNAAVNWIEHRFERTSDEQTLLLGQYALYDALLQDRIQAHGRINGKPLAPIAPNVWARVEPVAEWLYTASEMKMYGLTGYSSAFLPFEPAATEALFERVYETVLGEPPPPRQTKRLREEASQQLELTEIFFYSADVLRLWPSDRLTKPRRPRIGPMHAKIAESLARMPVRGGRSGDILYSPGPYSHARIAKMLVNLWIDRGDNEVPDKRTLERALSNYYKRIKSTSGSS